MPLEIERKFLVKGEYKPFAVSRYHIVQGYLSSHPERSVRIRIREEKAFLTIKGKGNAAGTTRFEWEKEISVKEAKDLLKLCEPGTIEKIRHLIPIGDYTFEVDEFLGANEGLILAEIELTAANTSFPKPEWLGKEVTGKKAYYNAYLSKHPYKEWQVK